MSAPDENAESAFLVGKTVNGKYRIDRVLGHGGMGFVVGATQLQIEEPVALKFLYSSLANNEEVVKRFLREAKAARKIKSEHVVKVLDVGTLENSTPFIVMEYLEGQDLDHVLRERGKLPIQDTLEYVLQACEALAEAHVQGMVHRDLKPANLFVGKRADGTPLVKLLDFGISKVTGAGATDILTRAGESILGSPLYMAPEQLKSLKDVDARSDIWALGVILFECLAVDSPFTSDSLPELITNIIDRPTPSLRAKRPDLPAELEAVILRCLEKDRADRHPDVAALATSLAPFAAATGKASALRIAGVLRAHGVLAPTATPPRTTAMPRVLETMMVAPPPAPAPPAPAPAQAPPPARISSPPSNNPSTNPPRLTPAPPKPPSYGGNPLPPGALPKAPPVGARTTGSAAWGQDRTSARPPAPTNQAGVAAIVLGAAAVVIGLVVVFIAIPRVREYRARDVATEPPPPPPPPPPTALVDEAKAPEPPPIATAPVSASAEPPPVDSQSAAPPPSAAPVAPPRPKVDCSTPYSFDADGRKHWKPECVK